MISPSRILSFFFLFFFIVLSQAREAYLYSSSVSYCSPPDAILIQQFDARYFKDNSSLVFDIIASTVLSDLNVTAKINLNAYGMEPVDMTFNLCEALGLTVPIFVLVLFQWTIGDSWLAVLLSVLTIVALSACLAYSAYLLVKVYRHHAWSKTTEPLPYPLLPYTEPWATHRWFATVAFLVPILVLKSAFTSFAKSSGFVQVIAFIIMDGVTLAVILVFKPGKSRSSDVLEAFIAFVRLVTSCCLVTFVETVKVKPIPRVAVGIVLMVLESVVIVVLFLGVLRNVVALIVAAAKRKMDGRGGIVEDDQISERQLRGMTMATTTSTDVTTSAHKSPAASHGGYGYGYSVSAGDSRSGATTPTDSRSILPLFAKEVVSANNNHHHININQPQGYSTSSFDIEKPETIYPKSYAPSSSATGLGLSFHPESKLSFDAFTAPIHAKYSTAGVVAAVPRASSDFAHSDSTHVGSATAGMNSVGAGGYARPNEGPGEERK
ncbi:hypothetical protein FRC01_001944 [Tulasnella sp. 417]|nr:hypothetical protein FRC01_001944 [Tulasnella sp. 417]